MKQSTSSSTSHGIYKPKSRSGPPSPVKEPSTASKSNSAGHVDYSHAPSALESSWKQNTPIFLLGNDDAQHSRSRQNDNYYSNTQSMPLDQLLHRSLETLAQGRSRQSASRFPSNESHNNHKNNNSNSSSNNNNNNNHQRVSRGLRTTTTAVEGQRRDAKATALGLSPSLMLNGDAADYHQSWRSTPFVTSPRLSYSNSNSTGNGNSSLTRATSAPIFAARTTPQVPKREAERMLLDVRQESKKVHKTSQLFLIFLLRNNGNIYRQKSFIQLNSATSDFEGLFAQFAAKHTQPQRHGHSVPSIDRIGYVLQHGNVYVSLSGMDQVQFDYLRWHLMRATMLDQELGSSSSTLDWNMERPSTDFPGFEQLERLLDTVVSVARSQREELLAHTLSYERDLALNNTVPDEWFRVPQASSATRYDGVTSNAVCLGTSVAWTGHPERLVEALLYQDVDFCEARRQLHEKRERLRQEQQLKSKQSLQKMRRTLMETIGVTPEQLEAKAAALSHADYDDYDDEESDSFYQTSESCDGSDIDDDDDDCAEEVIPDDWEQHSEPEITSSSMLDVEIEHDSQLLWRRQMQLELELARQGLNECRNLEFVLGHQTQLTAQWIDKINKILTDAAYADFREQDCRAGGHLFTCLQEVSNRLSFLEAVNAQTREVALRVTPKTKVWSDFHTRLDRQSRESLARSDS